MGLGLCWMLVPPLRRSLWVVFAIQLRKMGLVVVSRIDLTLKQQQLNETQHFQRSQKPIKIQKMWRTSQFQGFLLGFAFYQNQRLEIVGTSQTAVGYQLHLSFAAPLEEVSAVPPRVELNLQDIRHTVHFFQVRKFIVGHTNPWNQNSAFFMIFKRGDFSMFPPMQRT